ncbi:MAG: xanthine dehydrogenase family protein subunit M [Rhodopseudomonas sp.]|uniref:FAD binding domain-containing protein n=1 Tax=Rhodopseudomonas sp. TaxID=1078 RepID=UPI0017BF6693|nr:xanthine dehydrogenase family protein subunit M [Rhodopseudomonas sp.]NVN85723.1 xanthine dehydrogenase family protein subunit M [Rhodopseudomonas sp.]
MKPAAFAYCAPTSLDEAVRALQAADGDGKVMAGGQSLMPLLNFRMTRPTMVVDLTKIPDLSFIEQRGDRVAIGALTRHADLEFSALIAERLPVMSAAMPHVAHLAIRNRGTIGGSLSHADPAAELPMLAVFYSATIRAQGPAGRRDIAAEDFFVSALATCLDPDEIVFEIEFPVLETHTGWAFEEVSRRFGDFALACIALSIETRDGAIVDARVAVMGVADTPLRLRDAEQALLGARGDAAAAFGAVVRGCVAPNSDIHVSADYRRALIGALAEKAFTRAWQRAAGGPK